MTTLLREKKDSPRRQYRRRRDWGKVSPLDKLPEAIRAELRRRCFSTETFAKMREWLESDHGIKTTLRALCQWRQRQLESESNQAEAKPLRSSGFEIVIVVTGADAITVRVMSSAEAKKEEGK